MACVCLSLSACGGSTTSNGGADDAASSVDSSNAPDVPSDVLGETPSIVDAKPVDASTDDSKRDTKPIADSSGCIDVTAAGAHTFTCDGIKYDVEIPDACTTTACGLVVDVHGFTMSAQMEDANTAMRALGRKYGYVVVQPNANPAPPSASWTPGTDDDRVFAFVQAAIAALHVDRARVHFTGFSQGGMMTFRFLCKHADLFASMAPAAGTGCSFTAGDTPSREIPILYMHGTSDGLVSFTGYALPQRDALLAAWSMDGGEVIASDSQFKRTRYKNARGTIFEFLQHDYAAASPILKGHCYPGSTDKGGAPGQLFPFSCVGTSAFVWGEEAMKFFVAHPGK